MATILGIDLGQSRTFCRLSHYSTVFGTFIHTLRGSIASTGIPKMHGSLGELPA